ncbi:MAG: hypothetical protein WC741_03375 [Patescibacteria group bacterium]|jgi:predicted nucleotidyltransferase
MKLDKAILKTIKYFSFFAYNPTEKEIHMFLQAKISRNSLDIELNSMIKQKRISASKDTPPQYSIRKVKDQKSKVKNSREKLNSWRFKAYVKLISLFPQIKLVGLSGSISMMNAVKDDDIDLFIITAKNRLFTGRLIVLTLAQLLGLRRSRKARHSNNKICLNLFFDESNLKVPKFKQTEFVGHEVLQMKPIIVKGDIYKRFLEANEWVFGIFPNVKQIFNFQFSIFDQSKIQNSNLGDWIEFNLKKYQLHLINKHRTTEIITSTQLWFHPDDFEKKL